MIGITLSIQKRMKKNCNRKSTSSTNGVRVKETKKEDGVSINFKLYSMPSCDKCGEPWVKTGEQKCKKN
jgi:hypothetical protein